MSSRTLGWRPRAPTPGAASRRRSAPCLALLALLPAAAAARGADSGAEAPLTGKPWTDMDYGQFLTLTLEVEPGQVVPKGIAIRLDGTRGGIARGRAFVLFDTDTLRCAAAWAGPGFIDWRNIAFDGSHGTHASIAGHRLFRNPPGPGWGEPGTGSFEDRRLLGRDGRRYGPLDRSWAHWKGLYVHGEHVVLSYTVGGTQVLEMPSREVKGSAWGIARTFNAGPRSADLVLQVAEDPAARIELRPLEPGRSPCRELAVLALPAGSGAEGSPGGSLDPGAPPAGRAIAAAVAGGPEGTRWIAAAGGSLRLRIPPGGEPVRFQVLLAPVVRSDDPSSALELLRALEAPRDLEPLTRGGPRRWRVEPVTRPAALGAAGGPFAVDVITAPMENPYRSWMRFGGFDFLGDGERAAISTWQGDVWVVSGLGGELLQLTWQRIASGLFQPLGLKVRDGAVHVLGRDQITRLHDLDGDGETDFYENFNNDAQVTDHFHEFAMDLQSDAEGNFYYTKGARHALDAVVPQHGTLLRVAKDGKTTDIVASGFRAPNGLCVNGDGTFVVSDQEGHWTPENRIDWVRPGGFYGYLWSYQRGEPPARYDEPLCWVDHDVDISPSEQLWVTSEKWGALKGKMLSLSYGMGTILLVLHERVGEVLQGGVTELPIPPFPTGLIRARFHPGDGALYTCGLFGWSSQRTFPGGFYRIRRTDRPLHVPLELHVTRRGLLVRFSSPLDRSRAARSGSYRLRRWSYKWLERYGSDDFRVSDGAPGREEVPLLGVRVSPDGRSVFLEIDGLGPSMQMAIEYRLRARDGERVAGRIYHTIHELGDPELYLKELAD